MALDSPTPPVSVGRGRFTLPLPVSTWEGRLVLFLVTAYALASFVLLAWCGRQAFLIHRLTRGVGDTVFYAADGSPWFRLDEQRHDVDLAQISPWLKKAVIAVEDHRFYHHPGIDPVGLARAAALNLRRGGVVQGGSTLTQQLARTLFLSNQRTWGRKAKEALIALMLEEQLSKDQILELYLNRVYLGAGAYGVDTFSRKLFAKSAHDLSLPEAALVAGLVQAPSALSPWSNIDGALRRSDIVLTRMRANGDITAAQESGARQARLHITASPGLADMRTGYAKEYLRQAFRDHFGGDHPPDWEVHTTFMPAVQVAAERAVAGGLQALGRSGLQAALVAIDPKNGDILALVGGRDFTESPFNRAVRSRRQPGSAFKPIVYAAALAHGFSPVTVLQGLPGVTAPGSTEWTPRNAHDDDPESETLRQALLESNNKAAVALQVKVGSGAVLSLARDLGLEGLPDVPSLALGTGLVTPLDLTAAFAAFPNGGQAVAARGIVSVDDADGQTAFADEGKPRRVLRPEVAYQMVSMLRDVVDRGTASAARAQGVGFPVGGKTGTTSDFKDAWFVGFSSSVVAGVWVGYDQPAPIGGEAYGARVALPIWSDFMRRTSRLLPPREFEIPDGVRPQELCRISYLRPVQGCPTYVEYFKDGDAIPTRLCPLHEGSLKQDVHRAVDDLLSTIGKRLRGLFH